MKREGVSQALGQFLANTSPWSSSASVQFPLKVWDLTSIVACCLRQDAVFEVVYLHVGRVPIRSDELLEFNLVNVGGVGIGEVFCDRARLAGRLPGQCGHTKGGFVLDPFRSEGLTNGLLDKLLRQGLGFQPLGN